MISSWLARGKLLPVTDKCPFIHVIHPYIHWPITRRDLPPVIFQYHSIAVLQDGCQLLTVEAATSMTKIACVKYMYCAFMYLCPISQHKAAC